MGIFFSFVLGFLPMLFFAYLIYWLDRYEKEPKFLVGGVFLWGALIAAGGAFLFNTLLGVGVYVFTGSELATDLTTGSLIAPIVEESLKGLAVWIIFLAFHREFDSILDGIVYAAIVAIGFAATENVFYIYSYGYAREGIQGMVWVAFVRVILVGWQHPFYTAFTGIGLAVARLSPRPAVRWTAPWIGWGLAVFTHSAHNTISSLLPGVGGIALGTALDWIGWFFMFLFILWALYREQRWIINHLKEEVESGLLSPEQYRVACSAWAQNGARLSALFSGRYRATTRFYQACGELAYKKQQRLLLGEEGGNSVVIDQLRTTLTSLRPYIQS